MIMQKQITALPHNIILESRKTLRISGVKDIDSFTENRVILNTVMGEDLHVISLESESGDFSLTGTVSSMSYSRNSSLDGPVKRLFR